MRLQETKPPHRQFNAILVPAPTDLPGNLAIERADTKELIALRDITGVPNAPNSTLKYQLLAVTQEEKEKLTREGLVLCLSAEDYRDWYKYWPGPKPTKRFPF